MAAKVTPRPNAGMILTGPPSPGPLIPRDMFQSAVRLSRENGFLVSAARSERIEAMGFQCRAVVLPRGARSRGIRSR